MAKSNKTNFDRHLERELKNPKFVKGFCEELKKTRLAIKKSTKDPSENIIGIGKSGIKDGSIKHDHYLYNIIKGQKRSKRKKITNELLKLSKHTHPVSTNKIVKDIRKDRRRQVKSKTILDYAGTLPKLDISIDEAIEKAIEIVAREKSRVSTTPVLKALQLQKRNIKRRRILKQLGMTTSSYKS